MDASKELEFRYNQDKIKKYFSIFGMILPNFIDKMIVYLIIIPFHLIYGQSNYDELYYRKFYKIKKDAIFKITETYILHDLNGKIIQ